VSALAEAAAEEAGTRGRVDDRESDNSDAEATARATNPGLPFTPISWNGTSTASSSSQSERAAGISSQPVPTLGLLELSEL